MSHLIRRSTIESLESRCLFSAVPISPLAGGLTPQQVRKAYGFDQITFSGGAVAGDGTGQTVAIVDAYNDPTIAGDLAVFDQQFGLSGPPSLTVVNQKGTTRLPPTNDSWASEISQDVEWAHAIAPGAGILLVEANSPNPSNMLAGINYARNAGGVSVISMSWAKKEFSGEINDDHFFTTPAGHAGVTFVDAAGLEGDGPQAQWPAVSPYVLGVGGSTLTIADASGTYGSESVFNQGVGADSGIEAVPGYQAAVQSSGARATPDVSYDADPNTGYAVYDSTPYLHHAGWATLGGTSAGTPQWAALIAIANQGRALSGLTALDGPTGTLPDLYNLPSSDFHAVSGNSAYNTSSGLGSPKANLIVQALLTAPASTGALAATHRLTKHKG